MYQNYPLALSCKKSWVGLIRSMFVGGGGGGYERGEAEVVMAQGGGIFLPSCIAF